MFEVIKTFADLQDENYVYYVGDAYPRKGSKATKERITVLSGNGNAHGVPLIKAVQTPKKDTSE